MGWQVNLSEEAKTFLLGLSDHERVLVIGRVKLLEEHGPNLKRPTVGEIVNSRHRNMKELRVSSDGQHIRVLFAFDTRRQALLLCGGSKSAEGFDAFYESMIPLADTIFDRHIESLSNTAEQRVSDRKSPVKPGKAVRKIK